RDGQCRADPAHRRGHVRHRSKPRHSRRQRPREVAARRDARQLRAPGGSTPMTFVKTEDVIDAAKGMLERGLVSGTAGNVSGRIDENRVCLTPSSVSYETMTLDDLVVTDLEGNVLEGTRGPTSEKAL